MIIKYKDFHKYSSLKILFLEKPFQIWTKLDIYTELNDVNYYVVGNKKYYCWRLETYISVD